MDDLMTATAELFRAYETALTKEDSVKAKVAYKQNENRFDTIFSIPESEFGVIENLLLQLDHDHLKVELAESGLYGTSGNLQVKIGDDYIYYDIWSPDYETRERGLEGLFRAINQILVTGLINPSDVWN
ncbi:MAG: hypothetical protein GC178_15165 [Flavobacteriales bacterium]|nr:hypothetical protein [Flavobacteriales bacterium]